MFVSILFVLQKYRHVQTLLGFILFVLQNTDKFQTLLDTND